MSHPPSLAPPSGSPRGPFPELTPDERARSIALTLAERPAGPLYVFAYGSLLWRPCFEPVSQQPAEISGYVRRFAMWTVKARGTPQRPGLGLGLERRAGQCAGLVLEVSEEEQALHLGRLWEREMLTAVYEPVWLAARTSAGVVPAVGFVLRPEHPQYAGDLSLTQAARHIATAHGELGSCIDYLRNTVSTLADHGIADPGLERLLSLTTSYASAVSD